MKSKQTMFFGTKGDYNNILLALESTFAISYVETGLFDTNMINRYESFLSIPNLGFTDRGKWISLENRYMIVPKGTSVIMRDVPQRKGGNKYSVDSRQCADSVEFSPGGIYTKKSNVLVAGRVATISEGPFATELYKFLSSKIKSEFRKLDDFYVGNEAEAKLKEGWRLVTDEGLSEGFDLTLA